MTSDITLSAADVGAVAKTGDTMAGNLRFSQEKTGISLHATADVTGIYNGTGDGATQDSTNLQIKSWYGIGISPTAGLPAGMTMGQNSIWINARTGGINTIGSVTANGFKSTNAYAYLSEKAGHGMYLGTTTDNRTVIGGGSATDGTVLIRPGGIGVATGTTSFDIGGTITNSVAPTATGHLTNKAYVDSAIAAGNAATATKLATARQINGTNFDGSGNITTANWGTARTLTIGNSGKSVNGSANVSWTLGEIGAASQ